MDTEELIRGTILMAAILSSVFVVSYLIARCLPSNDYLPRWVCTWLVFTSVITIWDASFVLNRPHSIHNPIWHAAYSIYTQVDTLYADQKNDFIYSVSIMNLSEVALNILSVFVLSLRKFKAAGILALIVSSMTLSKTVLYFLMEAVSGFKHTKHNSAIVFSTFYLFPNLFWIFVPFILICALSVVFQRENQVKKD